MTGTTVPCTVPCLSLVSLRLAKRAKALLLTKGQGHPKGHHQGTPQIDCGTATLSKVSLVSLGFRKKHSGGTFARGEPPGHCKSPDSLYEEMRGRDTHQGTPCDDPPKPQKDLSSLAAMDTVIHPFISSKLHASFAEISKSISPVAIHCERHALIEV